MAHAPIAPSSLALTVACSASVQLQDAVPTGPSTDEEMEGTAAHWHAVQWVSGNRKEVGEKFTSDGREWIVDAEMRDGSQTFERAIGGFHWDLRCEEAVKISAVHPEHCWGTLDARRYLPEGTGPQKKPVLMIADYKYGHQFVEVYGNWQLIAYALGVMERLGITDFGLILDLIIVQPRSYHRDGPIRRWRVSAQELLTFVEEAKRAASAALAPDPIATTGAHCLDCRARHVCATLQAAGANIVDYSMRADLIPLEPSALGRELLALDAAAKRLEARRTGLAAQVEAMLRNGTRVPGWEMVPGKPALVWLDHVLPEDIAVMGDLMGVPLRKPLAILTPRQAINAGIDEGVIAQYAHRPQPALTLKPTSTLDAAKAFGVVKS